MDFQAMVCLVSRLVVYWKVILNIVFIYLGERAKPGVALQTPLSLIHWVSDPLVPTALRRHHAQKVRELFQLENRLFHSDKELFKSNRPSKLHHWFKSYGHFSKVGRFFSIGWVASGRKGLRLQPAQQACLYSEMVSEVVWNSPEKRRHYMNTWFLFS